MNGKRLYKSNSRIICGVCGGVAEFFGIDPIIVRVIWAALAFAWGTSILLYLLFAIIMNSRPDYISTSELKKQAQQSIDKKDYIDAEPIGFRMNNGEKEEVYR